MSPIGTEATVLFSDSSPEYSSKIPIPESSQWSLHATCPYLPTQQPLERSRRWPEIEQRAIGVPLCTWLCYDFPPFSGELPKLYVG